MCIVITEMSDTFFNLFKEMTYPHRKVPGHNMQTTKTD